jgi:hypothetical protein
MRSILKLLLTTAVTPRRLLKHSKPYQAFPAEQARRVLRRLEFHCVPKHARWLNMVEIEIGVLAAQCLDRRIDSIEQLTAETTAWEQQRNAAGARIKWMFTTKKARPKWAMPIHAPGKLRSHSKSHNHCAALLD